MKQKSQNRFLAALLAVAMMLQMLPMLAFADDAPDAHAVKIDGKEGSYANLKDAVIAAESGDTIILGEGNYTLYGTPSEGTTKGKDLTFEGQGRGVTTWQIGPKVPDPSKESTEYNGDYSFDGAGTVTFKNMTLCAGPRSDGKAANYLGFIRIDNTVVENCDIDGKTFYWGYQSAKFINTTFNAPDGDYAIWTYSSPTMTFDTCTFNASGKVINVYTDYGANKQNITVNFENCTVNSSSGKTALNINDSNMGSYKYILNITGDNHVTAELDTTTCTQLFGFGGKFNELIRNSNSGRTEVNIDGKCVWKDGKMQTHSYTDGEHDKAFTYTYSEWRKIDARNETRDETKTCNYCGWWKTYKNKDVASVYRLQYNLNEGVGDATADYSDANYRENESVTLAAAPTREGYQFAGWLSLNGKLYNAGSELVLTGDEVFTAYWKKDEPVVNHTLTVTGGTFAVKNGDIDVTDTLETSTDEASGKQTCLVPDGAEVTVTLDQTKVPEGMVFDLWSTGELPLDQDYKAESITFTMNDDVDVAAQYRSADIEDGSDVVGPIIVGTAVVAGGALVGYTLGTDLVGQMWGLPYFPSNRSALAMMLWEDAGKPMPESEILYPDVGQEEQDMDLQHAARWAMEHDLMPDLNDQDTELPPEQVKFYPDNMVTKISVLRAWKKAQDLKQNAQ